MEMFCTLNNVPVHSVINLPTQENALNFPKGDIHLGFCNDCGFISNMVFSEKMLEYSSNCEESQGFSPTFNTFAQRIAQDLIDRYDLHGKMILEIGCGKGDFLTLLCELGGNQGLGFDPAYDSGRERKLGSAINQVTFVKDYYSEKYTHYKGDFICCRMTLEHIQQTGELIRILCKSLGDRLDTVVFFQVPNVIRILRDCAFEDIYYEHCSYFSPGSLARLFRNYNFNLLNLKTDYHDQYIILEAKQGGNEGAGIFSKENDLKQLHEYVEQFQDKLNLKVNYWHERLEEMNIKKNKTILWGSGSKAVAFLTLLNIYDGIEYIVDINPYRQGYYMPGTGQKIVPPGFIKDYQPDIVIIMNEMYINEIKNDLKKMNLYPKIVTL